MTDSQREGWCYAITHAPYGLLKQLDRSVLAIWVVAEDLHREAAEKIAQYGLLTKSPNAGLPLQSPYLAILNKQAQIMLERSFASRHPAGRVCSSRLAAPIRLPVCVSGGAILMGCWLVCVTSERREGLVRWTSSSTIE